MCKNNWMKRIIAVSVAAGMLLNTTLPSLAESGTEGGYESQNAADDNSTVNDSLTDAGRSVMRRIIPIIRKQRMRRQKTRQTVQNQ